MQIKSIYRGARMSAFKAREVTREIQGLPVAAALDILAFTPEESGRPCRKDAQERGRERGEQRTICVPTSSSCRKPSSAKARRSSGFSPRPAAAPARSASAPATSASFYGRDRDQDDAPGESAGKKKHHRSRARRKTRSSGAKPAATAQRENHHTRITMGQKVNPIGYRLAVNRDWRSRWFASPKEFPEFLPAIIKIRLRERQAAPRGGLEDRHRARLEQHSRDDLHGPPRHRHRPQRRGDRKDDRGDRRRCPAASR